MKIPKNTIASVKSPNLNYGSPINSFFHAYREVLQFEMTEDGNVPFTFSGFQVSLDNLKVLKMYQQNYLDTLKPLPINATFQHFISGRMKLAWLFHTRPDVQYEVSHFVQVTEDMFIKDPQLHLKRLNNTVQYSV